MSKYHAETLDAAQQAIVALERERDGLKAAWRERCKELKFWHGPSCVCVTCESVAKGEDTPLDATPLGRALAAAQARVEALAGALRTAVTALETYDYDPRNGNTGPGGMPDEGAVLHDRMMERFRALLSPPAPDAQREERGCRCEARAAEQAARYPGDSLVSVSCDRGWWCPTSPDKHCRYERKNFDQCDFCGHPEERK
jgi:hypothetical protein